MDLIEKIEANADKARFHTPGHSGKSDVINAKYDVTELSYSDNLLHPQESIMWLEERIAAFYGAAECLISTQGATTSLREAIFATKDRGDFMLIGNVHSSVYNTMRLFSLRAYHVDAFDPENPCDLPPTVRTVVLTSPDYYGKCLDLEKICRYFHERGVLVICDAAHGSHFAFSALLPPAPNRFADLTVYSLHKTLPVATGGSVLLINDAKLTGSCRLARKIIHGTSPSYVTLCSIEKTFEDPEKYETEYQNIISTIEKFRRDLPSPFGVLSNDDRTRLVVTTSVYAGEIVDCLLQKSGFVAEMSDSNRVVFIVTPYNYDRLGDLCKAFTSLDLREMQYYLREEILVKKHPKPVLLQFGGKWEKVPLTEAVGRRLYLEAGLYPPGVPLVYSHETLTKETMELLLVHPGNRFGLDGDNVYALCE